MICLTFARDEFQTNIMMKTIYRFACVLAAALCLTACGDDDDVSSPVGQGQPGVVDPSGVFTGKMPDKVAGLSIARDGDGLVTEIRTSDGKVVTFDYARAVTRAAADSNYVVMTIEAAGVRMPFKATVGGLGFVTGWQCELNGDWGEFGYNGAGQMDYLKFMPANGDGAASLTFDYEGGNIVKTVSENYEYGRTFTFLTHYTSDAVAAPIANKGCVMIFDGQTFGVESREYSEVLMYLYYAGLLGRGTADLPVGYDGYDGGSHGEYHWELDDEGYPVRFANDDAPDAGAGSDYGVIDWGEAGA